MKAQQNEFKARVKEAVDLIYLTTSGGPVNGQISKDRFTRMVVTELVSRGVVSKTGCNSHPVYEWAVKEAPDEVLYGELNQRGWRIANGRFEKTTVMLFEEDGIRKVTV